MKRVAICTLFYHNYNYGGVLQAYGLFRLLTKAGFSASIVSYDNSANVDPVYPTLFSRLKQYTLSEIVLKIKDVFLSKLNRSIKVKLEGRINLFEKFIETKVVATELFDDSSLDKLGSQFDAFISGSDQVWNPNAVRRIYMLDFKASGKKISYAASISRNTLSRYEKEKMIPFIRKFDAISVREHTAKKILDAENIDGVTLVLDPTMLLLPSEWNEICPKEPIVSKPYVLVYSFSKCFFEKELVSYYSAKGVKVYYIPYAKQEYNQFDGNSSMDGLWNIGPAEFVSLVKNSIAVYTDSFHGAVFSILFSKQFVGYERDGHCKTSKNSRLHDLVESLGLEKRLVCKNFIAVAEMKIDYLSVNMKLDYLRKDSSNWLAKAIG